MAPPPPQSHSGAVPITPYASSIAKSMTIDEMRDLHRRALADADAKGTELRLVLASRYRELVGSSDEVLKMRDRAKELEGLVNALPGLVGRLVESASSSSAADASSFSLAAGKGDAATTTEEKEEEGTTKADDRVVERERGGASSSLLVRRELSILPRSIHRSLDSRDVHSAASSLVKLFGCIASRTDAYPLATALSPPSQGKGPRATDDGNDDPRLAAQMKMVYLHVQTLPARTARMSKNLLLRPSSSFEGEEGKDDGAGVAARALSSLDLLDVNRHRRDGGDLGPTVSERSSKLVDLYFDSKARLVAGLLDELSAPSASTAASAPPVDDAERRSSAAASATPRAERILSKIVRILQRDVILHPYQIFVLRRYPSFGTTNGDEVMSTLQSFDPDVVRSKASHFLAAHLPLVRTKAKAVLVVIAGTTASALGQIRQSLYDATDGVECTKSLDSNGVCSWDEAVDGMIDVRIVSHGTSSASATAATTTAGASEPTAVQQQQQQPQQQQPRKFSLWSALFSHTFSSLVHSLLTTSFHSVHARVVSSLRTSLRHAPPLDRILPHEAYRNALRIATDLDESFKKVSDDAHELLVHAEEREESERRLRMSLYVQTCEIMGRLLCELRRMLGPTTKGGGRRVGRRQARGDDGVAATKEWIVGRLCHLLKFRLTSLPTLLDPDSAPAASRSSGKGGQLKGSMTGGGMITLLELSSAFDIADDDDDGLITYEEAMEAMESAFSGTTHRGAEMVRDTLLLSSTSSSDDSVRRDASDAATVNAATSSSTSPRNVTLPELALLSARGLRHDRSGRNSALGTVQSSLDDIVSSCLSRWAASALRPAVSSFERCLDEFVGSAKDVGGEEWLRRRGLRSEGHEDDDHEHGDDETLREIKDEIRESDNLDPHRSDGRETKKKLNVAEAVGSVSPHVLSYLLTVSSTLNRSVCPSDSLPPVPSIEYARAMGIDGALLPSADDGDGGASGAAAVLVPNMMQNARWALLSETAAAAAGAFERAVVTVGEGGDGGAGIEAGRGGHAGTVTTTMKATLEGWSGPSLVQLYVDVDFARHCLFERNRHGFPPRPTGTRGDVAFTDEGEDYDEEGDGTEVDDGADAVAVARATLARLSDDAFERWERSEDDGIVAVVGRDELDRVVKGRRSAATGPCDLFLSSLLGEEEESEASSTVGTDVGSFAGGAAATAEVPLGGGGAPAPLINPLPSTRRFVLLPIQSEKSLNELRLGAGKFGKEKDDKKGDGEAPRSGGAGAVSAGFSFFSGMLKKK